MSLEAFPQPPPSPHKHDPALKPNPHPYAIKTTSTALLSRSNSAPHNPAAAARSAYVPPSPRATARSPTKSRSEYRGHRYSTSLSDVSHSPTRSAAGDSPRVSLLRTKRAETLPSSASSPFAPAPAGDAHPKAWGPAQLADYLATALRQDADGDAISAWVQTTGVTGRAFLRWDAPDLAALGVDAHWRPALLGAARGLRHSVLRGRIYGAGAGDGELYASSSSSLDLALSDADTDLQRAGALRAKRAGNGRVRGMVDRWERESIGSAASSDAGSEYGDNRRSASPDKLPASSAPLPLPLATKPEPSIEELLAAEGGEGLGASGSWGARAWEDMGVGVTVKRVADAAPQEQWDTVVAPKSGSGKSKGSFELRTRKGKDGSSGRVRAAEERRVVTAIFAPAAEGTAEGEYKQEGDEERRNEDARPTPLPLSDHTDAASADIEAQRRAHAALMRSLEERLGASVQHTRGLVERFRRRLAAVEARVEAMERLRAGEEEERLQAREEERLQAREEARRAEAGAGGGDPDSFAALPSYVLLVGLGVCAVVLRVMLRRVAGRNFRP